MLRDHRLLDFLLLAVASSSAVVVKLKVSLLIVLSLPHLAPEHQRTVELLALFALYKMLFLLLLALGL